MPAFETLFCAAHPSIPHLQPHPGLILHHGHSPRGPQEYLGWLVGCPPKETLHCCWITLVVFSSACSDWTYAGHHLLCPLLMAMLAKLWSQTEWAPPPRDQTATTSLHQSSCVDSQTLTDLIRTASGKGGGRNTETEATTRAWHERLQKLRLSYLCNDWWGWGW